MRAIDQQAPSKRFLNERRSFHAEIDADDQPFATDLADEIKFGGKLFESRAKLDATGAHVCEQVFLVDNGEEFECGRADERAAAEG